MARVSHTPYRDAQVSTGDRVEDLLSLMTLEEKSGLLFQDVAAIGDGVLNHPQAVLGLGTEPLEELIVERNMRHFNLIDSSGPEEMAHWHNRLQEVAAKTRLGIPVTISSDPRNAFTINNPMLSILAGQFSQWPESTGLAAIRHLELIERYADTVRKEYLAVGIRVALHPQIDLATEPRWVRVYGTFGEDASLTAEIVRAYIRGLQGSELGLRSVACMVKHFPGGGPQLDGHDPHVHFGREQIYPAGNFTYHLEPFKSAISAGCAQIMPYYGVPIGTPYEEVGFGFNQGILTGLLREELGFDGVICTDWGLVTDFSFGDERVRARAWGVEDLPRRERVLKVLEAGADQFGGEACPELVVELVRSGAISEKRIDDSSRRLLRQKFELGLFDNRYVDPDRAGRTVGAAAFVESGIEAQRASITVLVRGSLPLRAGIAVYSMGVDSEILSRYAKPVGSPDHAEVAIVRLQAPKEQIEGTTVEQWCYGGSLEFPTSTIEEICRLAHLVPTIVDVYLDRPAILTEILPHASGLVVDYGATDLAVLDVLFGKSVARGRLPFDLPSSMSAVEKSRSDAPFDTENPLFRFGFGLDL